MKQSTQERQLFEYAVLRLVPRVEREEFLNVGVVLYCAARNFLECRFELNRERICSFYGDVNLPDLEERLNAFDKICQGASDGGPIGQLNPASRFRWLSAYRSTILQTSRIHPGLCYDPTETLGKLFDQLVK
jgi:Protein of unknown function (DUF3037)